jgi:hypothetical protein
MRRLSLVTAGVLLLAAAAPTAAADTAMVRVLHGSPDAPAVDIYLDGARVGAPLAGLEFGQLTDYVAVPAGDHAIKVCAAADATVCPIDVPSVSVAAGARYTIAATNALASIEAQVLEDATSTEDGQALVRVVHFSADTPAIDVLTQDGGTTVVGGLAFPDATDYLPLDPGSYDLKVCAAGDAATCPLDPGTLELDGGRAYSVFAIGSLTGESLTAVVAVDTVGMPSTDTLADASADGLMGAGWLSLLLVAATGGTAFALGLRTMRARR